MAATKFGVARAGPGGLGGVYVSQLREAVRAFLEPEVAEGGHWESARVEQLLSQMAPDARYHLFAWQELFVGHDAIHDELLRQGALFSDGSVEFLNLASCRPAVVVERLDRVTMNGKPAGFHGVGMCEFDADGKLANCRDHVDNAEITAKVGRFGTTAYDPRGGNQ